MIRKVRMADELFELYARDLDGNRIHVIWGEPDAEGFYEPILQQISTDTLRHCRILCAAHGHPAHQAPAAMALIELGRT